MADINDFYGLGDLATFNQAVQQSDPYGLVARELNAWRPDTSTWSPMATGMTSFGKAFLSGMLGNYARQNAADQMNSVIGVLPQLKANPMAVAAPEGVDADAFSVLKGNAILRNFAAQAQEAEASKKFNLDILSKFLGKKVEVLGENEAYDQMGQGGVNPNSPSYKVGQDKASLERQLANDFNARVADFKYKEQGLRALTQAYLDPAGTSDYELLRRGAQSVEPGLAVRADDEASLRGAASILGLSYQTVKNAVSGETKLSPEVRAGILRIAKRSYDAALPDYNLLRNNFLRRARDLQVNESAIVPFGAAKPFDEIYPDLNINLGLPQANPISDVDSIVNRELARRGLAPDGTPLKAPLPNGPVRPY